MDRPRGPRIPCRARPSASSVPLCALPSTRREEANGAGGRCHLRLPAVNAGQIAPCAGAGPPSQPAYPNGTAATEEDTLPPRPGAPKMHRPALGVRRGRRSFFPAAAREAAGASTRTASSLRRVLTASCAHAPVSTSAHDSPDLPCDRIRRRSRGIVRLRRLLPRYTSGQKSGNPDEIDHRKYFHQSHQRQTPPAMRVRRSRFAILSSSTPQYRCSRSAST